MKKNIYLYLLLTHQLFAQIVFLVMKKFSNLKFKVQSSTRKKKANEIVF